MQGKLSCRSHFNSKNSYFNSGKLCERIIPFAQGWKLAWALRLVVIGYIKYRHSLVLVQNSSTKYILFYVSSWFYAPLQYHCRKLGVLSDACFKTVCSFVEPVNDLLCCFLLHKERSTSWFSSDLGSTIIQYIIISFPLSKLSRRLTGVAILNALLYEHHAYMWTIKIPFQQCLAVITGL